MGLKGRGIGTYETFLRPSPFGIERMTILKTKKGRRATPYQNKTNPTKFDTLSVRKWNTHAK